MICPFLFCFQEKSKYEVMTGMLKTSEDMIEFYADIINRYPAIIALIDPLRKQVTI